MKNGIVIPCYNEAERLDIAAFTDFLNKHSNYICCFVNDGSTDHTLETVLALQAELGTDKVIVIDQPQNMGKAEAVRTGAKLLSQKHGIKSVGFLDADLATGFEDYKNLVNTLEQEDLSFVFGSRKIEDNDEIKRSGLRALFSFLMGAIINFLLGMPIKDTQCGAKVMKSSLAAEVFNTTFISKWLFDVEMFFRVKGIYGSKVMDRLKEVALDSWEDVEGSKINTQDALLMPFMLVKIAFYNLLAPKAVIRSITIPSLIGNKAA